MRKFLASAVLALVAVVVALGGKNPGVGAHAILESSTPASGESVAAGQPKEIIFSFSEAIEPNFSNAYVVDSSGKRWEFPNESAFHIHTNPTNPGLIVQNPQPDGTVMPNGTYTVVWDVLSAVDGHRTKGAFAFFVGPPPLEPITPVEPPDAGTVSTPPKSLEVFVRWANFIAMAALIGATLFPFMVLPAGVERLGPSAENERGIRRALTISRVSTLVSAVALVLVSCTAVWVQAWLATGESSSLSTIKDFVSDSRYGEIWLARMVLAGGAVVCSLLILARSGGEWHESILHPKNTPWIILSALAIALPVTTSLNSHAAGGGDFNLSTGIDYVHLVAGGLWLGLLVQFVLVILLVGPRLDERAGFLAGSVRRFSWIAVPTVAVIVVTGLIQSIDRLGGIDELVDSDYGVMLLMKVLLLAPVVAIGAFNLFLFGPRFVRYARERARALLQMRPWERAFRLGVIVEVGLAVVILGVTALLTSTSPQGSAEEDGAVAQPTSAVPTPTADSGFAIVDDLSISVWAEPGMPGANQVNALIIDQEGDEETIERVLLRFTYLEDDLGVSEVEALPLHPPSHYVADTTDLSLPGEWEVEVIVRREGLLDTIGKVQIEIGA